MDTNTYLKLVESKLFSLGGQLYINNQLSNISRAYGPIKNMTCDNIFPDMATCLKSHITRFVQGVNMLDNIAKRGFQVLEIGACFPYYSYPFIEIWDWVIKTVDILVFRNHFEKNLAITYGDICKDTLGHNLYDLIIATEVIEHTPCPSVHIKNKLVTAIKPGGYLFVSFPIEGEQDGTLSEDSEFYHGHIKMFNEQTIENLFSNLTLIKKDNVSSPTYSHVQMLYRKGA